MALDSVQAEIEALSPQTRAVIFEAVTEGRAVKDESLALLAARWAAEQRRRTARLYLGIVGPLCVVVAFSMLWFMTRNDPERTLGAVLFAGTGGIGVIGLVVWAIAWRPLVRAERANLALAGIGAPPRRREPSNWVMAWLIAWPIAAVVGVLLRVVGIAVLSGPIGLVVWVALVWAVKQALDRREAEADAG